MTALITIGSLAAYMLLGIVFLNWKLSDISEEEARRRFWSPAHSVMLILLWPYFCFFDKG